MTAGKFDVATDLNTCAASLFGGASVTPAIANDKAPLQIESIAGSCALEHTCAWLAAGALVNVVVAAAFEVIQHRQTRTQCSIDLRKCAVRECAAGDVRLIRDHDQDEASAFQCSERLDCVGQEFKVFDAPRRSRYAFKDVVANERPVTI